MALIVRYNIELQRNRKVLNVRDTSIGWDTSGYELREFYHNNDNDVRFTITIEVKDKTYSQKFILCKAYDTEIGSDEVYANVFGTEEQPTYYQKDLAWHLLLSFTGNLVIVNSLDDIDEEDYDTLPDGIYTLDYEVDSQNANPSPVNYKEEFIVTNGSEQVIEDYANAIADNILVCRDSNIDSIADYLVKEGLLFAASKAAFISRKDRVLNILSVIDTK